MVMNHQWQWYRKGGAKVLDHAHFLSVATPSSVVDDSVDAEATRASEAAVHSSSAQIPQEVTVN